MKQTHLTKAVFFVLLQSVLYGIGNPLTKIAYDGITPLWCLFFRFTLATAVFLLLFGRSILSQLKTAPVKDYLPVSLCMSGAYISCNIALSLTSATNVGFIMSMAVVFAPVLSVFLLNEPYKLRHLPVQILVLTGLVMLCVRKDEIRLGMGEGVALLTALFIAGTLVLGKKSLNTNISAITISATQAGCTAVLSLVFALLFDDLDALSKIEPAAFGVVVYLALGCTCMAYLLQNFALSYSSPSLVSMVQCTQSVLTGICSFFILGEHMTLIGVAGAGIILVCTIIESYLER